MRVQGENVVGSVSFITYCSMENSEIVRPGLENAGDSARRRVPGQKFRRTFPQMGAAASSRRSRKL